MAGSVRKRQKKLEKSRKKRALVKKTARKLEAKYEGASLLRLAERAPFGPCWVSATLNEPGPDGPPALVTVVVTRRIRGQLLCEVALIDRTCLGVKNAHIMALQPEFELRGYLAEVGSGMGGLRESNVVEAQSVVFHALEYARSLGFGHHPDFELALFEPRPESLAETPFARPARPIYVSGPDDDVPTILLQLEQTVGSGNYDVMAGMGFDTWFEEDENEDEDEDEDHADVIETTAETSEQ